MEALKAFAAEARSTATSAMPPGFALDSARDARNAELYTPNTGLVDVALSAKTYVKALFGVNSTEYKRIASIEFRNKKGFSPLAEAPAPQPSKAEAFHT